MEVAGDDLCFKRFRSQPDRWSVCSCLAQRRRRTYHHRPRRPVVESTSVPGSGTALLFPTMKFMLRVGMAICFDCRFPEVWQRLADNNAQLVLFSSAYSGGRSLEAYATLHHYYIVSSIRNGECQAFDITGEQLLNERKVVSRITLDLDRRIFHDNDCYNYHGPINYRDRHQRRVAAPRESGRGDRQAVPARRLVRLEGDRAGR